MATAKKAKKKATKKVTKKYPRKKKVTKKASGKVKTAKAKKKSTTEKVKKPKQVGALHFSENGDTEISETQFNSEFDACKLRGSIEIAIDHEGSLLTRKVDNGSPEVREAINGLLGAFQAQLAAKRLLGSLMPGFQNLTIESVQH